MIPAAFEYHAPTSVGEATALLARLGESAKVLSGGQSLIPLMKLLGKEAFDREPGRYAPRAGASAETR